MYSKVESGRSFWGHPPVFCIVFGQESTSVLIVQFVFRGIPDSGTLFKVARVSCDVVSRGKHVEEFGVGTSTRISASVFKLKLLAIVKNLHPETVI